MASTKGGGATMTPPSSVAVSRDSTRCSQAECIASRNELELLKRDLDEIESENDQLHDQLAKKESECSALTLRLQQSESDSARAQQDAQKQMVMKDAEVLKLHGVIQQLRAEVKELHANENKTATTITSSADTMAVAEALRLENVALQKTLQELRTAMARETSASAHANQQIAAFQQSSKDKRDELYNALKENELLRQERQERDDALEKVSQLALDYEIALKVLHEQQKEYLEALDELRIDNAQQRVRIEQLEQEKEQVEAKLIEMDEQESDVGAVVRELTMRYEMEKKVICIELDELRKKATEWKQQQQQQQKTSLGGSATTASKGSTGPQQLDLDELEKQLEMVHELRVRDQLVLEEKDQEIQQLRHDLESLVEHFQESGDVNSSGMKEAVKQAVDVETKKSRAVTQENAALKRRLKEQNDLVEQLEMRQAQLDKELVDAQDWNAKYEAGAGLDDVMKYQKKIRKELDKSQLANQKLRQEINDQRDATSKIHVSFERLKQETGKSVDFEYDDLMVENYLKGELAVQQAVVSQLEHQLHELENERVKLLQKLRQQARVVGGKLYEAHGLTTDQWAQVEEFMDRVKHTPEVAKRWLSGMTATDQAKAQATEADQAAEAAMANDVKRLRKENARLRDELENVERRQIVHESMATSSDETKSQPPVSTTTQKKHAATSPLKQQQRHKTPSSEKEEQQDDGLEEEENIATKTTTAATTTQPQQQQQQQMSPEALAQAITQAIDARLAMLQQPQSQQQQQQQQLTSNQTHSGARANQQQPSPRAKDSHQSLAFDSKDQLETQIDFLREFQLVLDDYITLEQQNHTFQQQINKQESTFQAMMDQQALLYQHFFHFQEISQKENQKLQFDLQQLAHQNHDLQLSCQRYEASLHLIGGAGQQQQQGAVESESESDTNQRRLRSEIVELTKRIAHFEVSNAQIKREKDILMEMHQKCEQENEFLANEWLEMERVLKFRILYLENWKTGASKMISKMEMTLDKCNVSQNVAKQQKELENVLSKYAKICEEYVEIHGKYLELLELPSEISKLQHENAMLLMGKNNNQPEKEAAVVVYENRIQTLEEELRSHVGTIQQLETKLRVALSSPPPSQPPPPLEATAGGSVEAILSDRIQEVEQLYESLVRDHHKATEAADLAATQAHVLSVKLAQEKHKMHEKETQLSQLMHASDDHAVVAHLQQQVIQLKTNYQQFVEKYDAAISQTQQAMVCKQHLELEMENQMKIHLEHREQQRTQLEMYEMAICEFKKRDYMARNAKNEAFKKRFEQLEHELREEQMKRRALEKEIQENADSSNGFPSINTTASASVEMSVLKKKIQNLETRERVLMGQIDVFVKNQSGNQNNTTKSDQNMDKKEIHELQRVHNEMVRTVTTLQQRNKELLDLVAAAEGQKRGLQREKDDLEMANQELHSQWQLSAGGGSRGGDNQNEAAPSSPMMRKKVGLYEKDHLQQQQAAQASIASLKQLLEEKNVIIAQFQSKISILRGEMASSKANDRHDTNQLHKQLYDENQKMISQLKNATDQIYHLEKTGNDKKAFQATQDRHEFALQEWKKCELELGNVTVRKRELEMEMDILQNEKDLAEARAGEALEEIVLKQQRIEELEIAHKKMISQLQFTKNELLTRDTKMHVLRNAIIKLKEEFLKAEDRHAMEIAKTMFENGTKTQKKNAREKNEWKEEKTQLEAQIAILQEKLVFAKQQNEENKAKIAKLTKAKAKKGSATRGEEQEEQKEEQKEDGLADEVERLKSQLKDKVVGHARIVDELEKKIGVLQAQNLALRESSALPASSSSPGPARGGGVATATTGGAAGIAARDAWEVEKKLQRRVDVLAMRLKDKQTLVAKRDQEMDQLTTKLTQSEAKVAELQRFAATARDAIHGVGPVGGASGGAATGGGGGRGGGAASDELEKQNVFLQETLLVKRNEWQQHYDHQMDKYETQLERLRVKLSQVTTSKRDLSGLEREERAFVAQQHVNDELVLLGTEMKQKEKLLVEKDTRLLELELEVESLRVEFAKLHRKLAVNSNISGSITTAAASTKSGSNTTTSLAARKKKSSFQERSEMEEVVANMKQVIDKLRAENDKLKQQKPSPNGVLDPKKVAELRQKLVELRHIRVELQNQVDFLKQENNELKKDKMKLSQRVRLLVAQNSNTTTKSSTTPPKKDLHDGQAEEEKAAKRMLLINEQQKHQIEKLQKKLSEASDTMATTKIMQLQDQMVELENENDHLRHELSAFDHDFFEEIEDLKYKYAQAVRDKQQLEQQIQQHQRR